MIHNRRAVLAVCGHDFQGGQTSRIEAALLQQPRISGTLNRAPMLTRASRVWSVSPGSN